jgi:hypothetical protein
MSGTNGLGTFSATISNGSASFHISNAMNAPAVGTGLFLNPVAAPPLGSPGLPAPFVTGVEYYVASLNSIGQFTLTSIPGGSLIAATQSGAAAFTVVIPVLQGGAGSDYITGPQGRAPRDVPTPYSSLDVSYLNQRVETGTFGLSQPAVSSPGYAPPTIPHP